MSRPYLFYINKDEPFDIRAEARAASGRVVMIRYKNPVTDIGKKAVIAFRAATAANINDWKALAIVGNPVTIAGVTGMFLQQGGIQYQNEILGQNVDVSTSIPAGFDYWSGTLTLTITE